MFTEQQQDGVDGGFSKQQHGFQRKVTVVAVVHAVGKLLDVAMQGQERNVVGRLHYIKNGGSLFRVWWSRVGGLEEVGEGVGLEEYYVQLFDGEYSFRSNLCRRGVVVKEQFYDTVQCRVGRFVCHQQGVEGQLFLVVEGGCGCGVLG